jgi:hypothetical protein
MTPDSSLAPVDLLTKAIFAESTTIFCLIGTKMFPCGNMNAYLLTL